MLLQCLAGLLHLKPQKDVPRVGTEPVDVSCERFKGIRRSEIVQTEVRYIIERLL